ncbi:MAG: galactonate dehydratase [Acidobacteriia bacterium]|nr:galactonate dehydratase [Terriglobia bacterium]
MKITRISPVVVNARVRNWIFVKVETDVAGLHGWGEATLEWKTRSVLGAIDDVSRFVLGEDPRRIQHLWQIMTRQYFWPAGIEGMTAISGIEHALWDIKSKWLNVPLYELLGGRVRDRLRVYTHLGGVFDAGGTEMGLTARCEQLVDRALACKQAGYTALKFMGLPRMARTDHVQTIRQAECAVRALREAVGSETDLMVDLLGRCWPATALQVCRVLEPYELLFLEEPCSTKDIEATAQVTQASRIPIATGERLVGLHSFRDLLEKRACHIVQPDLTHCGGLWEAAKIASLAETYSVDVAPHTPSGPVGAAVATHFGFVTPNWLIQEAVQSDVPWRDDIVDEPLTIKDGHIGPPTRVGLGVEINEDEAKKYPFQPDIDARHFLYDGSVGEW